jgi:hypothetical protein
VAGHYGGKAMLSANLFATENVPAAHLSVNDALPFLSFPKSTYHLKLVNIGEVQAIVEAYPQEKSLAPMASLMRC